MKIILNDLKPEFVKNTYSFNKVNIWLAPSEGLLLDRITFDSYNKKPKIIELIEFSKEIEENIQDYKLNTIYREIIVNQDKNNVFENWLKTNIEN